MTSNSFIWNEVTGEREPIEDRAAFLADLARKTADVEAAASMPALALPTELAVIAFAPSDPAPSETGADEPAQSREVTGPVDTPAKPPKR